jgi:hypothetical protein
MRKILQPLSILGHHTPQRRLISKPRLEAHSKWFWVCNHTIHEARLVNRVLRVLRDLERPQEERGVDEDRAIRYVPTGADSVHRSSVGTT